MAVRLRAETRHCRWFVACVLAWWTENDGAEDTRRLARLGRHHLGGDPGCGSPRGRRAIRRRAAHQRQVSAAAPARGGRHGERLGRAQRGPRHPRRHQVHPIGPPERRPFEPPAPGSASRGPTGASGHRPRLGLRQDALRQPVHRDGALERRGPRRGDQEEGADAGHEGGPYAAAHRRRSGRRPRQGHRAS